MSIFLEHRQLLAQYREQKALGPAAFLHPSELSTQLIFDVSIGGLAWRIIRKGESSICQFECSNGYEHSLALASKRIQTARLKPGSGVLFHLWPPTIKISAMMVGPGQRAASATLLDETVQIAPDSFQLDPLLSYRVLDNGTKKVDLLGLGIQGFDTIASVIPRGVSLARMLGSLTVLEVLLEKIADKIPNPSLICIVEGNRLHYFGIRNKTVIGARVAHRNTLRDANDLKNTVNSMQIDPPNVLFVTLTSQSDDVECICQLEAEKNDVETRMTDRQALAIEYPELAPCEQFTLLPLSLLNRVGTPKPYQLTFRTQQESQVIPLTRMEMSSIGYSRYFSSLAYSIAIIAMLLGISHLLFHMQTAAWKVDSARVEHLESEWRAYIADKNLYLSMLTQIENIPRVDRLASLLCQPTPDGITLETIKFTNTISPSGSNHYIYEIEGTGKSTSSDITLIKNFVSHLQEKMAIEFPSRSAIGEVKNTTVDAQSSMERFNFTLKAE